jgi:transposase-like protein
VTDVTEDRDQAGAGLSAADEQVLRELTERARSGGLKLTGEGRLLGRLSKMMIEGALEGELDDHLGYGKHDPEGRDGGNSRNGRRAKTVLTDTGPVESRPLDPVYAVVFIDAINVKIREGQVANRPVYLALGVTVDGERDVLGLWAGEHGDGEGAKFWLRVLSEIKNRGVRDVCMLVCDGLKGLPDAARLRLRVAPSLTLRTAAWITG